MRPVCNRSGGVGMTAPSNTISCISKRRDMLGNHLRYSPAGQPSATFGNPPRPSDEILNQITYAVGERLNAYYISVRKFLECFVIFHVEPSNIIKEFVARHK